MNAPDSFAVTCASMRQTPFGVWNLRSRAESEIARLASMRQTPFGVWNDHMATHTCGAEGASMRQTPFGVWNSPRRANHHPLARAGFNEADAFRRLESQPSRLWLYSTHELQ